jgi:hypothetical protein
LASDSSSLEAGGLVVVGIVGNVEVVHVRGIGAEGGVGVVVVVFARVVEGYMCLAVCSIHCYPCCLADELLKKS